MPSAEHEFLAGEIRRWADSNPVFTNAEDLRESFLAFELAHPAPLPQDAQIYQAYSGGVPGLRVRAAGAGGGMSVALMLALKDAALPLPAGGILISPWVDLAFSGKSHQTKNGEDPIFNGEKGRALFKLFDDCYLNGADPHTPLASPLYGDLKGLPPLSISVGTAEVLLDDSVVLAERAQAAGVQTTLTAEEGLLHIFPVLGAGFMPEAEVALNQMGEFARAKMA